MLWFHLEWGTYKCSQTYFGTSEATDPLKRFSPAPEPSDLNKLRTKLAQDSYSYSLLPRL